LIARHGSREVRRRDKDATSVSREVRKQRDLLEAGRLGTAIGRAVFAHQRQPTDASSSKLGGAVCVQLT
jgi:hypothetical protein